MLHNWCAQEPTISINKHGIVRQNMQITETSRFPHPLHSSSFFIFFNGTQINFPSSAEEPLHPLRHNPGLLARGRL
jgi:hypothetical protein